MKLKYKKLVSHARPPTKAHETDAGYDLCVADGPYYNSDYDYVEYGTGIAIALERGTTGLLFPRSSISKTPLILANCVGVIDPGYTGEVKLRFKRWKEEREDQEYQFGDKIAQLIIVQTEDVEWEEVSELEDTERGTGGFGSSGK